MALKLQLTSCATRPSTQGFFCGTLRIRFILPQKKPCVGSGSQGVICLRRKSILSNIKEKIINKLLAQSAEFEQKMIHIFSQPPYDDSKKIDVSKIMCSVAFEHAESFKILLASHNFASAIGILRLQFESLVRAMWVFYVASDIAINKLTAELNDKNAKRASSLPMISKMISELESKAPKNAVDPILEFKKYSLQPLNSFVHGGLHAINRHSKGYPPQLLEQALKTSNGVNGMVGMFCAILSGNQSLAKEVSLAYVEFSECFIPKEEI